MIAPMFPLAFACRCTAVAIAASAILGCGARQTPAPPSSHRAADPHSYARPDRTVVSHLALDVAVDFTARQIAGTAALTVERRVPGAELVLDTAGLDIAAATECGTGR